jgi:hypothetical protein
LAKYKHGVIHIDMDEPDYSNIPKKEYSWSVACYPGAKECILDDLTLSPFGKEVVTTSFVDTNLYHDLISGRSVTGCLHMINKTPIDWFSKLQSTVETATFGSEYIVARTCTDH